MLEKIKSFLGGGEAPRAVTYQCNACHHTFDAGPNEAMKCESCMSTDVEMVGESAGEEAGTSAVGPGPGNL